MGCSAARGRRDAYLSIIRPDQRPPLVGVRAAADSLFGPAGESERGDGIAESRRPGLESLARRFSPTIVLPPGDRARVGGRTFQLLPCDPALVADTLRIDQIRAAPYALAGSRDIPFRALPADTLARLAEAAVPYESDPDLLETWYFDFPGNRPREWWQAYAKLRTGPDSLRWEQPVVFAHPFLDDAGRIVIQYWYYYPFNDYIANHEGDWEHINVVVSADRSAIDEVHYFFHGRSVRIPQGRYRPEIADETHPVVYVGGRAYMVIDYPIRLLGGERNSGSHGNYPYPGEWEAALGLGHPESVSGPDEDSVRVIRHDRFEVVLTPEPSRIDYRRRPEILHDWFWLLLPVRWGFPSAPSLGSGFRFADTGNRAPFSPAFNAGWNRTAPGLTYPAYQVKRIPRFQSYLEDLVQPWYYLYIFRSPRYVHDVRDVLGRREMERFGFAPRSGWDERGLGSTILGVHLGSPRGAFADLYRQSAGISLWRSLWVKLRSGSLEFVGGYQKFRRTEGAGGSLFVYPITASLVLRAPEWRLRPYGSIGGGGSGWESRVRLAGERAQLVSSGWGLAWSASLGVEYYLRPRVALDVALRYYDAEGPGEEAGFASGRLQFVALWIGHYVRF